MRLLSCVAAKRQSRAWRSWRAWPFAVAANVAAATVVCLVAFTGYAVVAQAAKPSPKNKGAAATIAAPSTEGTAAASPTGAAAAPPAGTAADASAQPAQSWLSAEDLRLGDFHAPGKPFPFPLLGDERAREIYVDREGKLYKERKYSGMIPEWGQSGALRRGRCQVQAQVLQWVGFQNNFDSSRIFIAVDEQACGYVYRPDDRHIVIDLPAVRIENANLRRDILTGAFPTPIELVHVEELDGRGTRITIALREPRRYLSAHVGRYVFVDVAR